MAKSVGLAMIFLVLLMVLSSTEANERVRRPKQLKFTLYIQAIAGGPNPKFVPVAGIHGRPRNFNEFGTLYVADLPVTRGIDLQSPEIGRSQGIQAISSPNGTTAYNTFSIIFTGRSEYNGSTLELQGVISKQSPSTVISELAIVGGTKFFRFAKGYAQRDVVRSVPSQNYSVSRVNMTISFNF